MLPPIVKRINYNTWQFKFWTPMWQADSYGQGCKSEAVNYKRKILPFPHENDAEINFIMYI